MRAIVSIVITVVVSIAFIYIAVSLGIYRWSRKVSGHCWYREMDSNVWNIAYTQGFIKHIKSRPDAFVVEDYRRRRVYKELK